MLHFVAFVSGSQDGKFALSNCDASLAKNEDAFGFGLLVGWLSDKTSGCWLSEGRKKRRLEHWVWIFLLVQLTLNSKIHMNTRPTGNKLP